MNNTSNGSHPVSTRRIVADELYQHIPAVSALLILMLVVTIINVFSPLLYKLLIDEAIPSADIARITWIAAGIVLTPLALMSLSALQYYFRSVIGVAVSDTLRQKLFGHVLKGQLRGLEQVRSTDIVYRITRACGQIGTVYICDKLLPLVSNTILLIGYLAIMLVISWPLALVALVAVPLSYQLAQWLTKYAYAVDRKYSNVLETGQHYLQEVFTGIRSVRSSNGEAYEIGRWGRWLADHSKLYMKSYVSHYSYLFLGEFVNSLLAGVVFGFGAILVVRGQISLGSLVAFVVYVPSAYAALRVIFQGQLGFGEAKVAAEQIDSLFALAREPGGGLEQAAASESGIEIEFRDVSFSYGRSDFAVRHLSFRVQAGQFAGIVGATGGGKSTVLDLLMGFYQPDEGVILVNGIDLRDLSLNSLRGHISLVPQDVFLWDASIRDNILYPQQPTSAEDMVITARLSQIHAFIQGLPEGYDTIVGDRGQTLSGGERQRLAICQSLLKQPGLLLLDEATSALDALTELKLREAVERVRKGRTTIVVAHRLSTIMQADNILVLDQGQLVESGAAAELIAKGGLFSNLYQAQRLSNEAEPASGPLEGQRRDVTVGPL